MARFVEKARIKVDAVVKELDLVETWIWVSTMNKSNDNPYHNLYHTMCMVKNCYEGAKYMKLPLNKIKEVVVAAMWHDFDHSGGPLNDTQNVEIAYSKCKEYLEWQQILLSKEVEELDHKEILECILVTEYPFVHKPINDVQKIIRDADLLQIAEPYWFDMTTLGLKSEFEKKLRKTLTIQEVLHNQLVFLDEHFEFFTEWGKMRSETELVQKRLETYRKIEVLLEEVA